MRLKVVLIETPMLTLLPHGKILTHGSTLRLSSINLFGLNTCNAAHTLSGAN